MIKALELRLHEAKLMRETKEYELLQCQDELARCKMELLNLRLAVEEKTEAEAAAAVAPPPSAAAPKPKIDLKQNLDKMKGIFGKKDKEGS